MRTRQLTLLVLASAAAIRFPHYDIAWFGIDQVYFLAEARRILAGDRNVIGPLSSGLNLLGPLYSYFVAGLLWIRNDAAFVGLVGAAGEVLGAWFLFDAARRLAGPAPGVVAALTYTVAPILVLSTRLIWNPSLLPMMVAIGWWMAVRYAEAPSTGRLACAALAAGLMVPLHPTGIFPAIGVALSVLVTRRPSGKQMLVGMLAGLLPIVPTLLRMRASSGDVGMLGAMLAVPRDFFSTVPNIVMLFLSFPSRLSDDRAARIATVALYLQAGIAVIGAVRGVAQRGPYRPVWIGLTTSVVVYLLGAAIYSGAITWYYLLALVPPCALFVAGALAGLPRRWQAAGAAVVLTLATAQGVFLYEFDRQTLDAGLLRIDSGKVMLRRGSSEAFGLTMREVRSISTAVGSFVPDGATALMTVHGMRGELWRESGAEFMPWAAEPQPHRDRHFTVVRHGICTSAASSISWRGQHRALAGWETASFDDSSWFSLEVPRRTPGPSLAGDPRFSTWRSPRLVLRGRLVIDDASRTFLTAEASARAVGATNPRSLLAITVHSPPSIAQALTEFYVNGVPLAPARHRVMYAIYRNEEWLMDLTGHLKPGDNVIAIGFAGSAAVFDLDVFEVPCLDEEFYF